MRRDQIDWLVVTAANEAQARGYRAQLEARQRDGRLEGLAKWMVIPDSTGARIGSGAATIRVLWKLAEELRTASKRRARDGSCDARSLFEGKRIVVLHSGGDSRRLPAYAAQGKIFAPLPPKNPGGLTLTLFDEVLADVAALRIGPEGRVIIAAGDLLLNASRWDPDLSTRGIVGLASPETIERGTRHGVYVLEKTGVGTGHRAQVNRLGGSTAGVQRFLQKPSAARMKAAGAIGGGRVLVDTGLVSLDAGAVAVLLDAAGVNVERGGVWLLGDLANAIEYAQCGQIDLYVHVLAALPRATTSMAYLAELESVFGGLSARDRGFAKTLYAGLRGVAFSAARLPLCDFTHIGTTRELLDIHGVGPRGRMVDGGEPPRGWKTGGRNLIVGLPGRIAASVRAELPRGVGLVALPIGARGWAVIAFGDRDDNKTPASRGGTLVNRPLSRMVDGENHELWSSDNERSAWTARVWSAGSLERSLAHAMKVVQGKNGIASAELVSPAEVVAHVNHARLIREADAARQRMLASDPIGTLDRDLEAGAAEIVGALPNAAQARGLCTRIAGELTPGLNTLRDARLLKLAQSIGATYRGADAPARRRADAPLDDAACDTVARAVLSRRASIPSARRPSGDFRRRVGEGVRAECPVRLDFAGGWTDTPPICHERGGAVVNASILLNGKRPLRATATRLNEPWIVLRSVDLGGHMTLRTTRQVFDHRRDGDWSALAKAALVLSGVAPASPDQRLDRWLERAGGGVEIEFESAVPKGSGLGTSSALGATILAALDRLAGRRESVQAMLGRATLLEQMMGTGGGWQDQAGAALGGTRILRTEPDAEQIPVATPLPLSFGKGSELTGRVLLYYTGHQRLAKDILRQIVLRYLARDRRTLRIIERLRHGAERAAAALQSADVPAFCRAVDQYWELKRGLDPGATTDKIEAIQDCVRDQLSACVMPGAGGGGFLFMIARDPKAAATIRRRLKTGPPNQAAGFYDFEIDAKGLTVETRPAGS